MLAQLVLLPAAAGLALAADRSSGPSAGSALSVSRPPASAGSLPFATSLLEGTPDSLYQME
jgi:hypothetical protein